MAELPLLVPGRVPVPGKIPYPVHPYNNNNNRLTTFVPGQPR